MKVRLPDSIRPKVNPQSVLFFTILALCLVGPGIAKAEADPHPLEPADTSSPRATLKSFTDNMNSLYGLIKEQGVSADSSQAAIFKIRAIRCLDLSNIDPAAVEDLGEKRAVILTEILDRIELPALKAIPDADAARRNKITRWRIPDTEIGIVQIMDGPRQGEYLFSAETVSRLPEFFERVKNLPYRKGTVLEGAFKKLFTQAPPVPSKTNPLKPADTASPQATMRTFLDNVSEAYRSFKAHGMSSKAVAERRESVGRAIGTLNLSKVPRNVVNEVGLETGVLLSEIFDRIEIPVIEDVPDAKKSTGTGLKKWTIPDTEITIARVEEGPLKGEFLFSPETVRRARIFYEQVEHLPYKDGTVLTNAYHIYLQAPGKLIPISWVLKMPSSLQRIVYDQPLWKWIGLVVVLFLLAGGLVQAFRFGIRKHATDQRAPFSKRIIFPISGIGLALLAEGAITQINVGKDVVFVTSILNTLLVSIGSLWLVVLVSNAIAEAIVASPRIRPKGTHAQVVRICFRLVIIGAFVLIVLHTANQLGVPLTPVLAGLGIGGLAFALAAQNTVENFIGGFNLFTDRPIRVGDFCRFGSRVGTVEEIGLRTTRIRSLDDTVIAIPNSTFSKMELENYSKRRKFWYHPRIQLTCNATPDQIRFVLVEVRKMLYSHPKVGADPARIRFAEFGAYSLDLDIFSYVTVTDYGDYLGVAEDLNLRIMDILAKAGTSVAVPAQRTLIEREAGLKEDRVQQTEQQVQQWRENDQLYLPSFPEEVVSSLRHTLAYPPKGAPGHSQKEDSPPDDS